MKDISPQPTILNELDDESNEGDKVTFDVEGGPSGLNPTNVKVV